MFSNLFALRQLATGIPQLIEQMQAGGGTGPVAPVAPVATAGGAPGGAPMPPTLPPELATGFRNVQMGGGAPGLAAMPIPAGDPEQGSGAPPSPGGGGNVERSTASLANPSTPGGYSMREQPRGNLLVRLTPPTRPDSTGAGALKAIEMSKGKSKWGAIATGLAAGMAAQEAANQGHGSALNEYLTKQFGIDKDMEGMRRQAQATDATSAYYNNLAQRGEAGTRRAAAGPGGSGRTITPEERAWRTANTIRLVEQGFQNKGLQGDALKQAVDAELERLGIPRNQPAAPMPGQLPAAGAVGHGQPVNVPPGAPPGTPKIQANGGFKVGQTATNKQTGQKMRFNGTTWDPVE